MKHVSTLRILYAGLMWRYIIFIRKRECSRNIEIYTMINLILYKFKNYSVNSFLLIIHNTVFVHHRQQQITSLYYPKINIKVIRSYQLCLWSDVHNIFFSLLNTLKFTREQFAFTAYYRKRSSHLKYWTKWHNLIIIL